MKAIGGNFALKSALPSRFFNLNLIQPQWNGAIQMLQRKGG